MCDRIQTMFTPLKIQSPRTVDPRIVAQIEDDEPKWFNRSVDVSGLFGGLLLLGVGAVFGLLLACCFYSRMTADDYAFAEKLCMTPGHILWQAYVQWTGRYSLMFLGCECLRLVIDKVWLVTSAILIMWATGLFVLLRRWGAVLPSVIL